MVMEEAFEGGFQQLTFEFLYLDIVDRPLPQFSEQRMLGVFGKLMSGQIGNGLRRNRDGGWLEREGAERIIRTVIIADLVDRQGLQNIQAMPMTPINHLAHP